ncbi:MAG TPA: sigma-70 family RNA polymerase sigma factor [Bryobacteraceae bacterium]|nr:sigma-70 family RNA polymerase sigma factor [Bryobacteraceae bacterium]
MSDYPSYIDGLYEESSGRNFGLTAPDFARILREIGVRYLPADAGEREAEAFYRALRLEDLALARGCAEGNDTAWDCFLIRYRTKLYDAATGIARDESVGRELADSLYTDLYGMRQSAAGERVSKLASYTGRGSLEGWLRTVLAQEYINRYRRERRTAPFDETVQPAAPVNETVTVDPRLEQATSEALKELPADDRLLLASYYLDGRKLAEIARVERVHESTISRRLDRLASALRKRIVRGLRDRGLTGRAAEEMLDADVRDIAVDVRATLLQERDARAFPDGGQG